MLTYRGTLLVQPLRRQKILALYILALYVRRESNFDSLQNGMRSKKKLCYVMLRYVTLRYVMLCYVMLCYVRLGYLLCYVLCYVILRDVMLCYVMLCYVMLCYVMLCYVMLCCNINVRFCDVIP